MAKSLSQLRSEKDKTQREVAEDLKVGVSTIAMYETGQRTPSLQTAKRLARYFGVSVEDIFFGNGAHNLRANSDSKEVS
ncbi:MAG TPA: transcriptional regulator [Desulfosporosinus sp.]|nr:transcriptional regulator [Desulfosporosinus sp.]